MPTAILVDGAFFLRRFESCFPDHDSNDPKSVAHGLGLMSYWHLAYRMGPEQLAEKVAKYNLQLAETRDLYRIFFYDCPPLSKRMHSPIGRRSKDFGKTEDAIFRTQFHKEVQKLRKVALRLGRLNKRTNWRLTDKATLRLIEQQDKFRPQDEDFELDVVQKGVDMRLGLDVASLAFKRQVDQIVIVAADADFVPAAKLARREGIDIVLDRMGVKNAASDLIEHVDGIRDCFLPAPKLPEKS